MILPGINQPGAVRSNMKVTIEIGDIDTVKDLLTHLSVIKLDIEKHNMNSLDMLSRVDLSDSNCYGWHEVEIKTV